MLFDTSPSPNLTTRLLRPQQEKILGLEVTVNTISTYTHVNILGLHYYIVVIISVDMLNSCN